MSYLTMYSELTGAIPKLPSDLARTFVNRAWADVRRRNLWSFQLFEANWTSPALVTAGTVATTQGLNTVTFDATASAAIVPVAALAGPFPTPLLQRQFRVGIGTIYNIWAVQNVTGIISLTLDRAYAEPTGTGQSYQILQCYYPVPYQDFLMWINIRDIVNFNDLVLTDTRYEIDFRDPQRTIFYLPTHAVYYQQNQNPNNAPFSPYGTPLYELWGVPQFELTYQLYGIRKGTPLVNDGDNLPPSIGEDCVIAKAKYYAYQWAEANKGDMPRDAGSDYRFLMGSADAEFKDLYTAYRRQDRETVDNFWALCRHRSWIANVDGFYQSIGQMANPGAPW